jgi:hypothetical protein
MDAELWVISAPTRIGTRVEARRIALNIAKLPALLKRPKS